MPTYDITVPTRSHVIRLSETDGRGIPLVLLHGSGASRAVFQRQFASPLARAHRLLALDLPGHGDSSNAADPTEDYTIPALALTVGEVLAARNMDRAVVMGWSLGGHLAIELMATNPAVAGVMIVGTPPISPGPLGMLRGFQANLDLLLASKEHFTEREALRFYQMCYHGNGIGPFLETIRRADGRVRSAVSRSLLRGDGVDQRLAVENASVPLAVVNGERESVTRLSYVNALGYNSLWRNHCHIIANAGHAPFWDQPDAFNRLLGEFAADVASNRAFEPELLRKSA